MGQGVGRELEDHGERWEAPGKGQGTEGWGRERREWQAPQGSGSRGRKQGRGEGNWPRKHCHPTPLRPGGWGGRWGVGCWTPRALTEPCRSHGPPPTWPQPPRAESPQAKEKDLRGNHSLRPSSKPHLHPLACPRSLVPHTPPHAWHQLPLLRDQHRPGTAWRMLR